MVDHLKEAKFYAHAADGLGVSVGLAQLNAQLAIAHGIIALVEQGNKATKDAEAAAEHADLICDRLAQRRASERIP